MDLTDFAQIKKICDIQEKQLRLSSFSNKRALELGLFFVEKIYEQQLEMAVAIRKLNGNIVFQHVTDKTSLSNQNWMLRKFNTVALTERCSLWSWASSKASGTTPADAGLDPNLYAFCGGGFPIRLESGLTVGVLTVSNLPHIKDHDFLVTTLAEYLDLEKIPHIE